jgi:hypothetical protein
LTVRCDGGEETELALLRELDQVLDLGLERGLILVLCRVRVGGL